MKAFVFTLFKVNYQYNNRVITEKKTVRFKYRKDKSFKYDNFSFQDHE